MCEDSRVVGSNWCRIFFPSPSNNQPHVCGGGVCTVKKTKQTLLSSLSLSSIFFTSASPPSPSHCRRPTVAVSPCHPLIVVEPSPNDAGVRSQISLFPRSPLWDPTLRLCRAVGSDEIEKTTLSGSDHTGSYRKKKMIWICCLLLQSLSIKHTHTLSTVHRSTQLRRERKEDSHGSRERIRRILLLLHRQDLQGCLLRHSHSLSQTRSGTLYSKFSNFFHTNSYIYIYILAILCLYVLI